MEEPWSKICIKWVGLLKLAPCTDILSLSDGKFFLSFMKLYLNLDRDCFTISETFGCIGKTLRNEFPFPDLVKLKDAQQGHEEELVKVITLFMYLSVVKYEHFGPKNYLHDDAHFSEEAKFRMKCILKALLEQHGVLTPGLLTEIIGSKISDVTGQLSAPVQKIRNSSRPSMGSPIIFASSPNHDSPLKEFLDSPTVRQATKYQRLMEERNTQNRELRAQLETEKMEKQFAVDELEHLKKAKVSADMEVMSLKQEMRERSAASDLDMSRNNSNSELSEKFHSLLEEKKDGEKYHAIIEMQLEEQMVEKEQMRGKLELLTAKLATAQDEKHRVDLGFMEIQTNLASTKTENGNLQENIQDLRQQLDDLSQQLLVKSMPRKGNMTFHLEQMDMTNVSVDADDSCNMPTEAIGNGGENMMDVVEKRLEEKIEGLGLELDTEKEARACDKDAAEARIAEIEGEVKEREQDVEVLKGEIVKAEEKIASAGEENKMLKENVEKVKGDLEVVNANLEDTKAELGKSVEETNKVKVDLKNCEEVKSQFESRVEMVEKDKAALMTELTGEKQVNDDLKRSIEIHEQSADQNKQEIISLTQNMSTLETKLGEAADKEKSLVETLEERSKNIEKLVAEKDNVCKEKLALKSQLEDRLAKTNVEIDGLKVKISEKDTELEKTQNELGEYQAGFAELAEKIKSSSAKVDELAADMSRVTGENNELRENIAKSNESKQELEEKLNQKSSEISSLQQKCESYISELEVGNTQKAEVMKRVAFFENELSKLKTQSQQTIDNSRIKVEELEANKESMIQEIKELNGNVTAYANQLKEVTDKEAETKLALDESLKNLADMKEKSHSEVETLTEQNMVKISSLEEELKSCKDTITEMTDICKRDHTEVIEQLKLQLVQTETKISDLEKEHKNIVKQNEERISNLTSELQETRSSLEERDNTVCNANEELSKKAEEISSLNEKYNLVSHELKEEKAALEKSSQNMETLKEETYDLGKTVKSLKEEIVSFKEVISSSEAKHIQAVQEKEEVAKKLSSVVDEKANIESENATLKASVLQLEDTSKKSASQIESMNKEIENKNNSMEKLNLLVQDTNSGKTSVEQELMDLKRQKIDFEQVVQSKTLQNESLQKDIEKMMAENAKINETLVALTKEKETIVSKNTEENNEMQSTLEKIEMERQDLSMEKQQMTKTIEDMSSKVENTDSLVESLQQEKDSLASRCSDLEDERAVNIAKIANIEKDVEQLQEEKRVAETDKHRMEFIQSQMEEFGATNDEMKVQLDKADMEVKKSKAETLELQKELAILKKDLEAKNSESLELFEKMRDMTKTKEEAETLNSKLNAEVEKVSKEKEAIISEQETQKKSFTNIEKLQDDSKTKINELQAKVDLLEKEKIKNEEKMVDLESQVESTKVENVKISEHSKDIQKQLEVEKLQGNAANSNVEEVNVKVEKLTEEKRLAEEENLKLEGQVKEAKEQFDKVCAQSKETSILLESEKLQGQESQVKIEELNKNLEKINEEKSVVDRKLLEKGEKIKEISKTKEDLAASVSQLLTDTNQLKSAMKNYENEKSNFVKENQSLVDQNQTLNEKISELELKLSQLNEEKVKMKDLQSELDDTKQELAREQIKYTDLEQSMQSSADQDTKTALKSQKDRYEKKHQEIVKGVMEKNAKKMEDLKNMCIEKNESLETNIKQLEQDKNIALDKYEESKKKVNTMMEKVSKMEAASEEEMSIVRQKYNAAKDVIRRYKEENDAVNSELKSSKARIEELTSRSETEITRRELVTVKTENRRLTTQLSHADTKLREASSLERRSTLGSRTSLSSDASSTSRPSRQSQAWKTCVEEQPRTSSTSSVSDDKPAIATKPSSLGSRGIPTRKSVNSARQSYSSLPGRKSMGSGRQSLSSLPESDNEGDNDVFKMPSAANTPGRSKAGRTVSDSKMAAMAASGFKLRPPSGSGSLFHCDEEEGELFSSSYLTEKAAGANDTFSSQFSSSFLTDMKAGRCEVNGDGRMSELSRRNTLCLPHLKSSYPIESQFLQEQDCTEDDIRQSKIKLKRDFPEHLEERHEFQSPVSNLSHKTEGLSLESPSRNTRLSRQSLNHPGNAHRNALLKKSTSNLSRLSTSSADPKPGRAKRQSGEDSSEPPKKKTPTRIPLPPGKKPTSWNIPVSKSSKSSLQPPKPKMPELLSPEPIKNRKRKSEERELAPELDSSQDSQSSSFSRDSLRGSKRVKREDLSYHKPGPPTPGRNKSHNNSLESLGSVDSAATTGSVDSTATTASAPAETSIRATPNASRLSTRSTRSHDRTPLLNTTNTPTMSKSVRARLTPQGIKKVIGSAFRVI